MSLLQIAHQFKLILNLNSEIEEEQGVTHEQNTPLSLTLALCSCFLNASAFLLMKFAQMKVAKRNQNENIFLQPLWLMGFICTLMASGCDVMAMNYGNQMLLASMTSFGIIINCILSVIFLKENFTKTDAFSIVIICLGATTFMMNAKNVEQEFTHQKLYNLLYDSTSISFLVFVFLFTYASFKMDSFVQKLMTECYFYIKKLKNELINKDSGDMNILDEQFENEEIPYLKYIVQSIQITAVNNIEGTEFNFKKLKNLYKVPMIMLPLAGGMMGGLTATFMRFSLLAINLDKVSYGNVQLSTVPLILTAIFAATSQLVIINKSIAFYDQVEVIPVYNTFLIFMNIFCGAVILDEYKVYSTSEIILLFTALCISVCGIFMLVRKPNFQKLLKCGADKQVTIAKDSSDSIGSLRIDLIKNNESNFDSQESFDGIIKRTTRANSCEPMIEGNESSELHYTCFENHKNYSCPCMKHSLNMFNLPKLQRILTQTAKARSNSLSKSLILDQQDLELSKNLNDESLSCNSNNSHKEEEDESQVIEILQMLQLAGSYAYHKKNDVVDNEFWNMYQSFQQEKTH